MSTLVHKHITGTTAVKIALDIEQAIRGGILQPGDRLPPVRDLAGQLAVSPATVASAYQTLQARAVLVAHKRRGTRVGHKPMAAARRPTVIPKGVVDLSDGNPDPKLLPAVDEILCNLNYKPRLYGEAPVHTGLIDLMRREMKTDGVSVGQCAVVNGTMDGIDRLLAENLRPGDRVAVEDPGFTGHHDLVASRGLTLVPVRVDDEGMMPEALERACVEGVQAALITLRSQSPTGAAVTPQRARELRRVLQKRENVLVIEDDHMSFLCDEPCACVHNAGGGIKASRHQGIKAGNLRSKSAPSLDATMPRCLDASSSLRWAHFRSLSKSFNPDLRLAVMTGDDSTMTAILDRLVVVERWVSGILQATAHALLSDKSVRAQVKRAGRIYDERREALMNLLRGIPDLNLRPMGRTGYNIWLPVTEETSTVQNLAHAGWAVAAGERFRLGSPTGPGIRITASRLEPKDAKRFAGSVAEALAVRR